MNNIHDISIFQTWASGETKVCRECPTSNRGNLRSRVGILVPDVVLYGTDKTDSQVEELMNQVAKDVTLVPLVMVVGTSLAQEVVDTTTIIKEFKTAGCTIVYVNPEPPHQGSKKLVDLWIPITAAKAATLLGFKRKPNLVQVEPVLVPVAKVRRGVKKLFPVLQVYKDTDTKPQLSPKSTEKKLEKKIQRREYYLKWKEKRESLNDRLNALPKKNK